MATVSGVKAGKAFVIIESIDKTQMVLNRVRKNIKNMAASITDMGTKLIRLSALSLIPFALGSKVFMGFDDAMRRVEARSSGTAEEMEALRNQAKELGRTTSFTAGQVGELQSKLAQKGYNRSQIKAMTADVMNLAKAAGSGGEEDATVAADLVSGTLRAFQKDASEAARITDIFTAAVNNSNFSLESLMEGMSTAGTIGASYKLSVEETVALVAAMTDLNIGASEAGNAMKAFLLNMSSKSYTSEFNKELQAITGNTVDFVDAAGNLRSPTQLFTEIGQALKGVGTADRGRILQTLFGKFQAGKAMGSVDGMANAMKLLDKLMNESQGTAKETATAMEAGLGGAFRAFMSAVEGVGLALGKAVEGPLRSFSSWIQPILTGMATWIEKNGELVGTIAMVLVGVGAVGAGMVLLGWSVGALAMLIGVAMMALKVMAVAMAFLVSPIGLVIGGIVAFTASLITLSEDVANAFGSVLLSVRETMGEIVTTFSQAWGGIMEAISTGDLALAGQIAMQGLKVAWLSGTNEMWSIWNRFISNIVASLSEVQHAMANAVLTIGTELDKFGARQIYQFRAWAGWISEEEAEKGIAESAKGFEDRAKDLRGLLSIGINLQQKKREAAIDATMRKRSKELEAEREKLIALVGQAAEKSAEAANAADVANEVAGIGSSYDVNKLKTGSAAAGGGPPGQAIEALQQGSVEALKAFIDNQNKEPMEELVTATKEHVGIAKNIEGILRGGMIGNAEYA